MSSRLNKANIIQLIIERLTENFSMLVNAARAAHEAATHEENIADNKYDTLSLEASYIAQGQANRAQEIRLAIAAYQHLSLRQFDEDSAITLTALVTLEAEDGSHRTVFLGPQAGGLAVEDNQREVVVITPASPLGRELLGKEVGEMVEHHANNLKKEWKIIELY